MKCVLETPREYLEELGGEWHSESQHSVFLTLFWYSVLRRSTQNELETMTIFREVNKTGYVDPLKNKWASKKFNIFGREQEVVFLGGKGSYDRRTMLYNHCLIWRVYCKISFRRDAEKKNNIQVGVSKTMLSKFMIYCDDKAFERPKFIEL